MLTARPAHARRYFEQHRQHTQAGNVNSTDSPHKIRNLNSTHSWYKSAWHEQLTKEHEQHTQGSKVDGMNSVDVDGMSSTDNTHKRVIKTALTVHTSR